MIYSDNQGIVSIVRKGSMVLELNELAKSVYGICAKNCISLTIEWIPRERNVKADELSKMTDRDDWSVSTKIFHLVQHKLTQPFDLDPFADNSNAKCFKFYSKHWCEKSSGVNAFAFNWTGKHVWLVPPINLITPSIKHAKHCKVDGILIVPVWRSAAFWAVLFPGGSIMKGVKRFLEFRQPSNFFISGQWSNDVFTELPFRGEVYVLRFDFTRFW